MTHITEGRGGNEKTKFPFNLDEVWLPGCLLREEGES